MTKMIKNLLSTCLITGMLFTSMSLMAQQIPLDPTVRTGRLSNGLTYYIKYNKDPQKRAHLTLANKVGSILEDENQLGLAHFMEHMNFNGTKHFPKNQLVDYLEKMGVTFGAEINAYTSYDETVFSLPIPLNDPEMLHKGLNILRDWAHETTLDPEEIDKERGVILEEERLHKGLGNRIREKTFPFMVNHSRYGERNIIGTVEILKTFKPEEIVRFKNDWYRPDLQAIIVVGDIDVDKTESMIKATFSDLNNPVPERERIQYTINLDGKNQFVVYTDDEQANTNLQILFKRQTGALLTCQDYKIAIKEMLLNQMLAFRRYEMTSRDSSPDYLNMRMGLQPFLSGVKMMAFDVTAKQGKLKEAFMKIWGLVERIRINGFTEQGLEQAKTSLLNGYEKRLTEKDHISSNSFAEEYVALFLKGNASPGIVWENIFVKSIVSEITIDEMNKLFRSYLEPVDRDIVLLAPTSQKENLPDEKQIEEWMSEAENGKHEAFSDKNQNIPLVDNLPAPGRVIKMKVNSKMNITEIMLSNGARVILKPTAFKSDDISFNAFSKGGISLYDSKDFLNASNATGIISSMGLGAFGSADLQQKIVGKSVSVYTNMTERFELAGGHSSKNDLETALQLLYLKFTAPRKDSLLFANMISRSKEGIINRYVNPENVFADTIRYVLGNYNYRYAPPTLNDLSSLNLDEMYRIYKERFADASGFTFVFVGNFEVNQFIQLLEKYIGALPSSYRNQNARDLKIRTPEGHIQKRVFEEKENKATVRIYIHGGYKYSVLENLKLKALGEILQMRMTQVLREGESEVYTPSVMTNYNKEPISRFSIMVGFGCSPQNVDHLTTLVSKEVENIRTQGVSDIEIEKFKAAYRKNLEQSIQDNMFWLGYLTSQYQNGENIDAVNSFGKDIDKITGNSLLKAAQTFLDGKNVIAFELMPNKKYLTSN